MTDRQVLVDIVLVCLVLYFAVSLALRVLDYLRYRKTRPPKTLPMVVQTVDGQPVDVTIISDARNADGSRTVTGVWVE